MVLRIYLEGVRMDKIIWQSTVTEEMVTGLTGDEIELLIADLDDAIQATIEDWGNK
jgi:hypothetical protein